MMMNNILTSSGLTKKGKQYQINLLLDQDGGKIAEKGQSNRQPSLFKQSCDC